MELSFVTLLSLLCVFLTFLISPSVSLRFDDIPSPYDHRQETRDDDPLQHVPLPRKLKLAPRASTYEFAEGVTLNHKPKTSSFSGRVYKKGEGRKEKLGLEEDRMTEFMGMDYARVRRRRPIHNKSLPTTTFATP